MSIPAPAEVAAQLRANADQITNLSAAVDELRTSLRASQEAALTRGGNVQTVGTTDAGAFVRGDVIQLRGEMVGAGTDARWQPGLLDSDAPRLGAWHDELLRTVEERSWLRLRSPNVSTSPWDAKIQRLLGNAPGALSKTVTAKRAADGHQRIFTDSSNVGGEFIPDIMLPILTEKIRGARRVEALFDVIQAPSAVVDLPRITNGGLRPYRYGVQTSDSPVNFTVSSLATDKRAYTIPKMAVRTIWDDDAAADSVIAMMPVLQAELGRALIDGFEDAIINGDTAGTHGDTIAAWDIRGRWGSTGLGGTADHRRLVLGLRARALDIGASVTDDISSITNAKLLALRANHEAGTMASDLVWIVSPEAYITHIQGLSEVVTLEKYGPQATILTGEIARIQGIPIIVSDFVSADLNASGVFDNVTTTKTAILCVNRSRHRVIERRGVVFGSDMDINTGTTSGVVSMRKGFTHMAGDTEKSVSYGYNL